MSKNPIRYLHILLALLILPLPAKAQNCGPGTGYPCPAAPVYAATNPAYSYRPPGPPVAPQFLHNFDIAFSSDAGSIDYRYEAPLYDIVAGYLRNEDDDGESYYAGVLAGGYYQQVLPAQSRVGIGVTGIGIDVEEGDGGAVALAGQIRFPLNIGFPGLALEGKISYAPSFTSFGDIEEYFELDARVVYNALPNASIFVGLRNIGADVETKDGTTKSVKLDDGLYGGIRLRFW